MTRRTSPVPFALTILTVASFAACSCGDGGDDPPGGGGDGGATRCDVPLEGRIRITEVDVGTNVVANEDEAGLRPIVIAPIASGGSRLAFMGGDGDVHVVTLDASDHLTGSATTIAANDFSDLRADADGGVLLLTRDALAGGTHHCGTLTNLCGASDALPTDAACSDMYMVRFDGSTETWATKLTDASVAHPPYLNSPTDSENVTFVWWYAHHGRIATDGDRFAAYYGAAISVSQACGVGSANATGVNIHQGDQMRVLDADGTIVSGGFDWGCSHSGYEHIVWDAAASEFVTVCKTDNQNRIAIAPGYDTIRPVDLAYSNFGGIVAVGSVRWLITSDRRAGEPAMSNGDAEVHLLRFEDGLAAQDVVVASAAGENHRAPHLAAYGDGLLLALWESSTASGDLAANDAARAMFVRTYDAANGAPVGAAVPVSGVRGNRYHDLRAFPDGSAAFPARSTAANTVTVMRVMPCE